jgi:predicted DNA-binding mobile mystery protein A
MSKKLNKIALKIQRNRINEAAESFRAIDRSRSGWIKDVREALGMSGVQFAIKLGVGRARVSRLEKSEVDGTISLRSLNQAAEAMACKLVYAIVPDENIESVIDRQAEKRAKEIVETASVHMALEDQSLTKTQLKERILELKRQLAEAMPKELWDK